MEWRKMSKIMYPSGTNETIYLAFDNNGVCEGRARDETIVLPAMGIASHVAELNAKLHPASASDRQHMVAALEKWIGRCRWFLGNYEELPNMKTECSDTQRQIKRMEEETRRLEELVFLE